MYLGCRIVFCLHPKANLIGSYSVFDSPMGFTSFHDENDVRIFRSDNCMGSYRFA